MTSGFGQPMVGIQQPVNPFGGPVVTAQPVYPGQVQQQVIVTNPNPFGQQ